MIRLAEKIESIAAKIEGGFMPDEGDRGILISAAEYIRIFHNSVAEHGDITLQKLESYRHNLGMSTISQVIADEAISEIVRLTRKVILLESRLKSDE